MKPPPPEVVRRGGLVRIAGGPGDAVAQAHALAFLDLRFDDGHVERWTAGGSLRDLPVGPDDMPALETWARRIADEYAFSAMCDVARSYDVPSPAVVDRLPCEEIVVEWNCEPKTF
ncbi:MAG: hypothetical protein ACEQSX_03395 [Baekduiaceae bacterium]